VVLEAWRYAATCPRCGATTAAAYPAGFEPTRVFGPHLEALWTYLHEQHHVSYARLATIGRDLWRLAVSQGTLANALTRVAQRLGLQAAAIREQVRASPTIGSDETSARVNGRTHWQWVFQTPTASYSSTPRFSWTPVWGHDAPAGRCPCTGLAPSLRRPLSVAAGP